MSSLGLDSGTGVGVSSLPGDLQTEGMSGVVEKSAVACVCCGVCVCVCMCVCVCVCLTSESAGECE